MQTLWSDESSSIRRDTLEGSELTKISTSVSILGLSSTRSLKIEIKSKSSDSVLLEDWRQLNLSEGTICPELLVKVPYKTIISCQCVLLNVLSESTTCS